MKRQSLLLAVSSLLFASVANVARAEELDLSASNVLPEVREIFLEICQGAYRDAFGGKEIKVSAVHAGLECGMFKVKNPKLDMISVGPTVLDPHSVNEQCDLGSCEKVFALMRGILARIPEAKKTVLPAGSDQ